MPDLRSLLGCTSVSSIRGTKIAVAEEEEIVVTNVMVDCGYSYTICVIVGESVVYEGFCVFMFCCWMCIIQEEKNYKTPLIEPNFHVHLS